VLGVHPVVIKAPRSHQSRPAMNVYEKASAEDIRAGLRVVSEKLLGERLATKEFATTTPKQSPKTESAA
jgi:hypothetical protein